MTDHEMLLLRAAVEAAQAKGLVVKIDVGKDLYLYDPDDAMRLLTDLGADVPEWPSEEWAKEEHDRAFAEFYANEGNPEDQAYARVQMFDRAYEERGTAGILALMAYRVKP